MLFLFVWLCLLILLFRLLLLLRLVSRFSSSVMQFVFSKYLMLIWNRLLQVGWWNGHKLRYWVQNIKQFVASTNQHYHYKGKKYKYIEQGDFCKLRVMILSQIIESHRNWCSKKMVEQFLATFKLGELLVQPVCLSRVFHILLFPRFKHLFFSFNDIAN